MCVVGKNLINPYQDGDLAVETLMVDKGQNIFKKESRNILNVSEWKIMQSVHDSFLMNDFVIHKYLTQLEKESDVVLTELKNILTYD